MLDALILMPLARQRGGSERMLVDLLRHAPADAVQWQVVFFREGPLVDTVREMGVEVHVVEAGRLRHLHRYMATVWAVVGLVRERGVDVVVSWSAKPHLYGSVVAQLTGVDAVWYQLGFPEGRHLGWMDRLATLFPARGVIAVSRSTQEAQSALWPQRPARVVYPGVRTAQFDPDGLPPPRQARARLGLPEEGPLVGIVGRLQHWKGMHTLVEAMPEIRRHHPEAHAIIVGGRDDAEPEYASFLDRLIRDRGLDEAVIRAGFQSNVPLWMQAMDVVVHASDREPFGIVIIEAMALEKPVVATDEGGPEEIITEGRSGLLAPFEDDEALANKVRRYLENPGFARRIGGTARERALEFSPERYARRFVGALRNLLSSPVGAAQEGQTVSTSSDPVVIGRD